MVNLFHQPNINIKDNNKPNKQENEKTNSSLGIENKNSTIAERTKLPLPNPKVLWGQFVTRLRENNHIALYVACGDIENIELTNEKLIIKTINNSLFNRLQDYKKELTDVLHELQPSLIIEIQKLETQIDLIKQDLMKLKSIFKDDLTIN